MLKNVFRKFQRYRPGGPEKFAGILCLFYLIIWYWISEWKIVDFLVLLPFYLGSWVCIILLIVSLVLTIRSSKDYRKFRTISVLCVLLCVIVLYNTICSYTDKYRFRISNCTGNRIEKLELNYSKYPGHSVRQSANNIFQAKSTRMEFDSVNSGVFEAIVKMNGKSDTIGMFCGGSDEGRFYDLDIRLMNGKLSVDEAR